MSIFKRPKYVPSDPAVLSHADALDKELRAGGKVSMRMTDDLLADAMRAEEDRMVALRYEHRYEHSPQFETMTAKTTVSPIEMDCRGDFKWRHFAVLKALQAISSELQRFAEVHVVDGPHGEKEVFVSIKIARPRGLSLAEMRRENDQFRREYQNQWPVGELVGQPPSPPAPKPKRKTALEEFLDSLEEPPT